DEDDRRHDDPGHLQDVRRFVILGDLVVGRAAVLDGQVEDGQKDEQRDAAGQDAEKDEKRVDLSGHRRGLLGKQRKVGQHHGFRSLRSMMMMNPASEMIVATPPARTMFMAVRLYLPVAGS